MNNQTTKPFDITNDRINFGGFRCILKKEAYRNNRTALGLYDERDGGLVCVATSNVPREPLGLDEVIIKNHSENEGILETLESAGVIARTGRTVATGFVDAPVSYSNFHSMGNYRLIL